MPAAVEIFRADQEDAEGIARVHARAREAAYGPLVGEAQQAGPTLADRTAQWRTLLEGDGEAAFTLIAERGGAVVGLCSVATVARDPDLPDGTGEVAALYVDPPAWGSGIGGALLTRALDELRESGCRSVSLWVLADNTRGIAFYGRHGFAPDGFGGPDARTGQAKIRLRASL